MAFGFYSHQYSKGIPWLNYRFRLEILNGIDELDRFCDDVRQHMTSVHQRGNFYEVQVPYAKNALTIGSPCNFGEEKDGMQLWTPLHYKTYRLFYDAFNRCIGVIVRDKWTIKDIYDKFCRADAMSPELKREKRLAKANKIFSSSLLSYIKGGQWSEKVTIWRGVFKRTHPLFYNKDFGSRYEYWDVYFEDTPKDKNEPLMTNGYFTKPFVVWDFEKNKDEAASRTPAFYCLYDDVTLNQIMFNYITNTQLKSRPPMQALKEMQAEGHDFGPGDHIYLERSQWEFAPKKIDVAGELRHEFEILQMFRENCERHFHTKLFNILTELALNNKQPISATQALEIQDEKISQVLPMIESNDNYLWQVNDRAIDIEYRAGRGPFDFDNMMYIQSVVEWACAKEGVEYSFDLVPEFVGKLRNQQQMEMKLKPLRLGLAYAKEVAESIDPNLPALAMRGYETLDDGLAAVGFPAKNIKPKEQYEEDNAAYQQAQAQQIQFQNAVEMAKATKGAKQVASREVPLLENE